MILLSARLLRRLGLTRIKLLVNSLGTPAVRAAYRERLTAYFGAHEAALDEDSKRRLQRQPAAHSRQQESGHAAPHRGCAALLEALDAESKAHFEALCAHLRGAGIEYDVEPRLVRGLDYYTRTVFEWTTDALGSQSTVCAGGRYDGLGRAARRREHARHRVGDGAGAHRHAAREAGAGDSDRSGRSSIWCWSASAPRRRAQAGRASCATRGRTCACR